MSFLEPRSSSIGVAHGASRSAWAMVVLSLALLAFPAPASAQNLLDNPNLDSSLSGWDGNATFDSSLGSPSPGSARLQVEISDDEDGDDATILVQCIDGIVAGGEYSFGGRVVNRVRPSEGFTGIAIGWHSDSNCIDDSELEVVVAGTTSSDSFQSLSRTAVAPAGTVAALIVAVTGVEEIDPGPVDVDEVDFIPGTYDVNADSLFLVLESDVPTMGTLWFVVLALALVFVATKALRSYRPGDDLTAPHAGRDRSRFCSTRSGRYE